MTLSRIALIGTIVLAMAGAAQAATLVQYTFGTSSPGTANPTSEDPLITGGAVTAGAGGQGDDTGLDGINGNPVWSYQLESQSVISDLNDALTNGAYFSFTMELDSGYQMDLTQFQWDQMRAGGAAYTGWALYSSLDSYASALGTGSVDHSDYVFDARSVTLSETAVTGSVEFRVYHWGNDYGNRGSIYSDNVTVTGTITPIPEPATMALLGVGGLGALLRRRR